MADGGRSLRGAKRASNAAALYRSALLRLVDGRPNAKQFAVKQPAINAKNVAIEAGLSRNPLYSTHTDILEEIRTASQAKVKKRRAPRQAEDLAKQIQALKNELAIVRSENATLLFQLKEAEDRARLGISQPISISSGRRRSS